MGFGSWLLEHNAPGWGLVLATTAWGAWHTDRAQRSHEQRRAQALRRLLAAQGQPRQPGAPAVLLGTLRVLDGPCARLDDGAPAAAYSVASAAPGKAHHARAASLALEVRGEALPLLGPSEVDAGSHETGPVSWFDPIPRLPEGLDYATLRHRQTRLRSVSDGDLVEVRGRWVFHRDDGSSYRGHAGWAVAPMPARRGGTGAIHLQAQGGCAARWRPRETFLVGVAALVVLRLLCAVVAFALP